MLWSHCGPAACPYFGLGMGCPTGTPPRPHIVGPTFQSYCMSLSGLPAVVPQRPQIWHCRHTVGKLDTLLAQQSILGKTIGPIVGSQHAHNMSTLLVGCWLSPWGPTWATYCGAYMCPAFWACYMPPSGLPAVDLNGPQSWHSGHTVGIHNHYIIL